jgi:hypothetical protein
LALAVVACTLAAWLAGPAQANGPPAGVPASATAVQQAATPVVTSTPVRSPASPGRPAARVRETRAAAAESAARITTAAETSSNRTAMAAEPAANDAATSIETGANDGAANIETGSDKAGAATRTTSRQGAATASRAAHTTSVATTSKAADPTARATAVQAAADSAAAAVETTPRYAAAAVRTASAHTAAGIRTAPRRVAAVGAAPKLLVAAAKGAGANTVSSLGWIASTAEHAAPRRVGRVGGEVGAPSGDLATSTGAALPATADGHAPRPSAGVPTRTDSTAREARTQQLDRVGGELSGLTVPTTPAAPTSAATGLAGAAVSALLGLLALLIFASQRLGAAVRLRPASAPSSPFLALPERPG